MSALAIVRLEQAELLLALLLENGTLRSPVSYHFKQILYQAGISNFGPAITNRSAAVTKPVHSYLSESRAVIGTPYLLWAWS